MTTLAIDKLWRFLQSLSLTASNERWLAERLLESANAKTASNESGKEGMRSNYQLSPEIIDMSPKNRKLVSDNIESSIDFLKSVLDLFLRFLMSFLRRLQRRRLVGTGYYGYVNIMFSV